MDPVPNQSMPDGVIPSPTAMPEAQVVKPGAEPTPTAPAEVPPPPAATVPDSAISSIPEPAGATPASGIDQAIPPFQDAVAENLTPPEDSKAKITQVFMGLNEAMKGAGNNEEFKQVILEAAQGVVDKIMEENGFPAGTVNVDQHAQEELPHAA